MWPRFLIVVTRRVSSLSDTPAIKLQHFPNYVVQILREIQGCRMCGFGGWITSSRTDWSGLELLAPTGGWWRSLLPLGWRQGRILLVLKWQQNPCTHKFNANWSAQIPFQQQCLTKSTTWLLPGALRACLLFFRNCSFSTFMASMTAWASSGLSRSSCWHFLPVESGCCCRLPPASDLRWSSLALFEQCLSGWFWDFLVSLFTLACLWVGSPFAGLLTLLSFNAPNASGSAFRAADSCRPGFAATSKPYIQHLYPVWWKPLFTPTIFYLPGAFVGAKSSTIISSGFRVVSFCRIVLTGLGDLPRLSADKSSTMRSSSSGIVLSCSESESWAL